MRKTVFAAAITGCLALPTGAMADYRGDRERSADYHYREAERHLQIAERYERRAARPLREQTRLARVIEVEPVYADRRSPGGYRDSCIEYLPERRAGGSWAPAVLGAVVGGAVGHRIGDSHGDPEVAAVAGGLLGAAIGRDLGRRAEDRRTMRVRGPCTPGGGPQWRREPVEYLVHYRYNGRVYRTRMDYDPGNWVTLNGTGAPV